MTRTRFGVEGLVSFIKRHNGTLGLVKCAKFVGQGRGEGLMSDKDQQEVLSRFMLSTYIKELYYFLPCFMLLIPVIYIKDQ